MISGQDGILNKATVAAEKTNKESIRERVQLQVYGSYDDTGKFNMDELTENVKKNMAKDLKEQLQYHDGNDTDQKLKGCLKFKVDEYNVRVDSEGKVTVYKDGEEIDDPAKVPEIVTAEKETKGYYADINGDNVVDGVIYADLAKGNNETSSGGDSWGTYKIPKKETGLKTYYIEQESYNGPFGEKPVLASNGGAGEDRFYVMALEDVDSNEHYWYNSASGKLKDPVDKSEDDFGKGKENTQKMIKIWNKRIRRRRIWRTGWQ